MKTTPKGTCRRCGVPARDKDSWLCESCWKAELAGAAKVNDQLNRYFFGGQRPKKDAGKGEA